MYVIIQFMSYSDEERQLFIAGEATATIMGKKVVFTVLQQPELKRGHIGIFME